MTVAPEAPYRVSARLFAAVAMFRAQCDPRVALKDPTKKNFPCAQLPGLLIFCTQVGNLPLKARTALDNSFITLSCCLSWRPFATHLM